MTRVLFVALIAAHSALCDAPEVAVKLTAVPSISAALPLTNHSWWEYAGSAKVTGNPRSQEIRMRTEVIEVFERGEIKAAWLRGSPFGLMDNSPASGHQVIARVGQRIYIADSARTNEIRERLRNPEDKLAGLFGESELLLELPLKTGNTGNWSVSIPAGPEAYELTRREQSGFRTVRFEPGIGITSFAFESRASGEAASVKMVEYNVSPE